MTASAAAAKPLAGQCQKAVSYIGTSVAVHALDGRLKKAAPVAAIAPNEDSSARCC
jgi:hypothetical protein